MSRPRAGAIIVAAGRSARMGGEVDKILLPLAGVPVLAHSVRAFAACEAIDHVVLVANAANRDAIMGIGAAEGGGKVCAVVLGGERRQDSVAAGLAALPRVDLVAVHDGARPLVTERMILDGLRLAAEHGAAVAAAPVADTIKRVDRDEQVVATPSRAELRAVFTPQTFRRDLLEEAHTAAAADVTDDAALVEALGRPVQLYDALTPNPKITGPVDIQVVEALLRGEDAPPTAPLIRTGQGVDVHRFDPARPLILGGVEIMGSAGLAGHSDADALTHAVIDALLGAAALGDIGAHFPPDDPRWAGADSIELLGRCVAMLSQAGYRVSYVDATVVTEQPRLRPHIPAMRERLAQAMQIPSDAVSVKATTAEGLGALGRGEGLQAQAIAGIVRRSSPPPGDT